MLLAESQDYHIHLLDLAFSQAVMQYAEKQSNINLHSVDCSQKGALINVITPLDADAVISCLPYYCNVMVAEAAYELGVHYFDLTEDVAVTQAVKNLSVNAQHYFVSQCGLAPGFISIVTQALMNELDQVDTVKMRVGALPVNVSNALQYGLTWSTAGLINEYSQPCQVLESGDLVTRQPLEALEEIKVDGLTYEAFNTSGGVGSLVQSCHGLVKNMDYKTIRYPGHCAKMQFLMHELCLAQKPGLLQEVIECAIPQITQDVVLVYVAVRGEQNGALVERNYTHKFYPKTVPAKPGLLCRCVQLPVYVQL